MFLGASVIVGCGEADQYQPGEPEPVVQNPFDDATDLFPIEEGNRWVYETEADMASGGQTGSAAGEVIWTIVSVTERPDGKLAEILEKDVIEGSESRIWLLVSEESVAIDSIYLDNVRAPFDPPMRIAFWPAESGQQLLQSTVNPIGDVSTGEGVDVIATYKGLQEVDTAKGRMQAYRFDIEQRLVVDGNAVGRVQRFWFTPKVGIVRSVERLLGNDFGRITVYKLKDETLK